LADLFDLGESFPVTAAQLLPAFTEFLSSLRYTIKLAKNWGVDCGE
jgi:hypothetical protein